MGKGYNKLAIKETRTHSKQANTFHCSNHFYPDEIWEKQAE